MFLPPLTVRSTQDYKVHVGEHDVELKLKVSRFTKQPSYRGKNNDFAIIQLDVEVPFSRTMMPVCTGINYDSVLATTAGWTTMEVPLCQTL